jgi:hypothetical protein
MTKDEFKKELKAVLKNALSDNDLYVQEYESEGMKERAKKLRVYGDKIKILMDNISVFLK